MNLRKFKKDESGVAAIEFGILGPVFFALLIAIFEICWFVYSGTRAQRALEDMVYHLRTGNVYAELIESGDDVETWMRKKVCDGLAVTDCETQLRIKIEKFDMNYNVFASSSTDNEEDVLDAGSAGILMRVETVVTVPNIAFTKAIFGGGNLDIVSGLTFMTEPYS